MRVVLLGKGGSGKSSLAGLVCAELAERGRRVLALDADSVPGLSQVLGVAPSDDWYLAGMAERKDGGWKLTASPAEVVDRSAPADRAVVGADRIGASPLDHDPTSPAVSVVRQLATALRP